MLPEGELIGELRRRFDAQVVILYGSYARGEAGPGSDVDVICFCSGEQRCPVTFFLGELLIDAWIHPFADLEQDCELDKLLGGRVLLDQDARGAALLATISARLALPRQPLSSEQDRHLRSWVWKMLDRAAHPDLFGAHRRHWLLHDLPEIWCELNGHHFTGAQNALRAMMRSATELDEALPLAMRPEATLEDVRRLALLVVGPRPS